jgi:hypothetical protein
MDDTIVFSDSLEVMKSGVLEQLDISKELDNELKIINIISGDCGKCIDQITNWDTVLKNTDRDIGIAFIINTHDVNYFNKMLAPTISLRNDYILVNNPDNVFERNNHLEGMYLIYNSFLINNDNKLLLKFETPLTDKSIAGLYEVINNYKQKE